MKLAFLFIIIWGSILFLNKDNLLNGDLESSWKEVNSSKVIFDDYDQIQNEIGSLVKTKTELNEGDTKKELEDMIEKLKDKLSKEELRIQRVQNTVLNASSGEIEKLLKMK